jgi:hypothetical protein
MSIRTRIVERLGKGPAAASKSSQAAGAPPTEAPRGPAAASKSSAGPPLFLPDLSLWYRWHSERRSFPSGWEGENLAAICRKQGLPIWRPARPWRLEYRGLTVENSQSEDVRETRWQTSAGTLLARWSLGPDGDWWQTDYPATTAEQLAGAREIVESITYVPVPEAADRASREVGEDGVVALELPMRPLSDLLHSFLGWSEGLLLLWETPAAIRKLVGILEAKLQGLLEEIVDLPGDLFLSPDNLDGQFVSPDIFAEHLAPSYQDTAARLAGRPLVVHAGGPLRSLLPHLARCGIGAVEGVSGPPQSDATLAEAREIAGPGLALWGGIPQDAVLAATKQEAFEAALAAAVETARQPGMILGIADRIPPEALPERLLTLSKAAG